MRLMAEDFDWICTRAGIKVGTKMREAFRLRVVEEMTVEATAAAMHVTPSTVDSHVSIAWRRVQAQEVLWQDLAHVLETIEALLERADEPELLSVREEARQILATVRGHPNHAPETPVLDELGRPLGRRDPIISVDEALRMLRCIYWRLRAVAEQRLAGFATEPVPDTYRRGKADGSSDGMLEFVYVWPDGREEVRYRRPVGSREARALLDELQRLKDRHGEACPYRVRQVGGRAVCAST